MLCIWSKKFFKAHFLLVTSGNLGCTSRVCLSLSLASPIGYQNKKKNKTSPTISFSSLASSIGNLRNKTKSDHESLLALFLSQHKNWSYAAVFTSVQTGQNLHDSVSTFYKLHSQECFLFSHAKHVLAHFGFRGKSFFLLHPLLISWSQKWQLGGARFWWVLLHKGREGDSASASTWGESSESALSPSNSRLSAPLSDALSLSDVLSESFSGAVNTFLPVLDSAVSHSFCYSISRSKIHTIHSSVGLQKNNLVTAIPTINWTGGKNYKNYKKHTKEM